MTNPSSTSLDDAYFWFGLCCEEFTAGQRAYAAGDMEEFTRAMARHALCRRRFRAAAGLPAED